MRVLSGLGVLTRFVAAVAASLLMRALGALFLAAGVRGLESSRHFVPQIATVVDVRPGMSKGDINTSSRNLWSVRLAVSYRYSRGGRVQLGQGILDLGQAGKTEAERRLEMAIARHAPGVPIEVFVDPDDPSRSVLQRRGSAYGIPALVFGAGLVVAPIVLTCLSVREWWLRRRGRPAEPATTGRFLTVLALLMLSGLLIAALAVGMEREPAFWGVLGGAALVMVVMILVERGKG